MSGDPPVAASGGFRNNHMRLCVFEDSGVANLDPLTSTRPAFDLVCGSRSLLDRLQQTWGATAVGAIIRAPLKELCRLNHPDLAINDASWLQAGPLVLANARWLAPETVADPQTPHVGLINGQVAYVVPPATDLPELKVENVPDWLDTFRQILPHRPAAGAMMDYPWDLVDNNPKALIQDLPWFRNQRATVPAATVSVIGPTDQLVIDAGAAIEPFVVADTRQGPVMVDRGAVVHSFSRLEGPCYVGPDSWILGAKIRGGTIGPRCRVGGEFEACIFQANSNKYHDGFVGHSYVGEWVNFAAGTQVSDLRNDYGQIRVWVGGERIRSGRTKIGAFIGDHSKTGLSTLLNSGSVIGAFCHLLPTGSLLPPLVPAFCDFRDGHLLERTDLRQLFATAGTVLRRRGQELTSTHTDFFIHLFESTALRRGQIIRDREKQRWRRSI